MKYPDNTNHITALAAAPPAEVTALGERLAVLHRIRHAAVPQDGLYLLTLEDGIRQEPWHIGEIPVASALVEVSAADGRQTRGGAALMGVAADVVTAVAVCDAVLRAGFAGADEVTALVQRGRTILARIASERAAERAATRVDFADLADGGLS